MKLVSDETSNRHAFIQIWCNGTALFHDSVRSATKSSASYTYSTRHHHKRQRVTGCGASEVWRSQREPTTEWVCSAAIVPSGSPRCARICGATKTLAARALESSRSQPRHIWNPSNSYVGIDILCILCRGCFTLWSIAVTIRYAKILRSAHTVHLCVL